jgi:hypothetical protein
MIPGGDFGFRPLNSRKFNFADFLTAGLPPASTQQFYELLRPAQFSQDGLLLKLPPDINPQSSRSFQAFPCASKCSPAHSVIDFYVLD